MTVPKDLGHISRSRREGARRAGSSAMGGARVTDVGAAYTWRGCSSGESR